MKMPFRPALAVALAACAGLVAACPNDPTETDDLSWLSDDAGAGEAKRADLDVTAKDAWVYFSPLVSETILRWIRSRELRRMDRCWHVESSTVESLRVGLALEQVLRVG